MFDGGVAVEVADLYDEQDHVLVRIPLSAVHSLSFSWFCMPVVYCNGNQVLDFEGFRSISVPSGFLTLV